MGCRALVLFGIYLGEICILPMDLRFNFCRRGSWLRSPHVNLSSVWGRWEDTAASVMCFSQYLQACPFHQRGAAGAPTLSSTQQSPGPKMWEIWIPGNLGTISKWHGTRGRGALLSILDVRALVPHLPWPGCLPAAHCHPPPGLSLPVRLPFASSWLSTPSTCPRVPPWKPSCPCHVPPFMQTPLLSILAGPYLGAAPGGRGPSAHLHPADQSPGGSGRCALALSELMPLCVSPSARSGSGRTGRQEGKAA